MVIDLAAYRRNQAQPRWTAEDQEQELVCVNWEPARRVTAMRIVPAAPLATPPLPTDDEDLAAFQALAYGLATQI